MKRLVISFVLMIPSVAAADKNFMGGNGSHDCGKDPVVNINTGSGTFTLTGACKVVNVNGGDNKITAASIGTLNVNGATNTADCDDLGGANVTGSDNKVSYKKAQKGDKPGWRALGTGNSLTKGAGAGGGKSDGKGDGKGDGTGGGEPKADPKAAVIDCAKKPTWSTADGGGSFKFVGKCTKISVAGGDNNLYIDSVDTLDVAGAENNIYVGAVGTISVGGADNKITWKKALKGDKPTLKGQPKMNAIVQIK